MADAVAPGIVVMHPKSYREAKSMGEHLRTGNLVVLDLTDIDPEDSYRLVDFASGLIFGLQGNIDRVTSHVMLLVPPGITAIDDAQNLTGSFFNQS